jgi:hypothetical protein
MPPCAATVCDRVGKSLVMQAVLKPCSESPMAALSPAPPAPTTTASYEWSTTVYDDEVVEKSLEAEALALERPRETQLRHISSGSQGTRVLGGFRRR